MKTKLMTILAAGLLAGPMAANADLLLEQTDLSTGITYGFYFESDGITWTQAMIDAANLGGTLAILDTSVENAFVANVIQNNATLHVMYNNIGVGPWLGGYSDGPSGADWLWVDGSLFSAFANSNWQTGQPDWADPSSGDAQGLLYYNGGSLGPMWGDYGQLCGAGRSGCGAGSVFGYVVEYTAVPEPATLALFGLGLAGLGFARRRKV